MCFFYVFSFYFPRRVISVTTFLKEGRKLPGGASSGPISDSWSGLCKKFANWSRAKFKFLKKMAVLVDSRTLWQWIDLASPLSEESVMAAAASLY